MFEKIGKRNGQIVKFEAGKIATAVGKAGAATGEFDKKVAQKLTLKVVSLAQNLITDRIPTVEEIQDVVEEVLLSSPYRKSARAYIIYREQHARIREISTAANLDLVDQYLDKNDWRVNENSNMTFSLQGLNNYISSEITGVYWLNKIYPAEIRKAHLSGDFHIHDLSIFSTYCVGWDLFDLLVRGFGGVSGKVESKPAKHLRAALGQIANFFYTLQGESAGAQAFANFDTLLSPFIRYDNLSFPQVKQAIQEFIFNVNVPTRVGFQCVSEDTKILTPEGWQGYSEIKKGSIIKTFNIKTKRIENQKVNYVFKKNYKGPMYNLKNRIQDQLVSPQHKVVRKKFQSDKYILEPIEDIVKLKSPFIVPIVTGENLDKIQETYIQKVEKVNYKGVIWSPHTKNETIIARRKGKVFITGNTPFTNIALDLTPPKYFADTGVIIGGKPQKETYKEFQEEMDLINRAFLEVMANGDGKGRVFTFPIPTYNITKDFDWENSNMKLLWQVTAKYGIPYFSNFINSDMDPADARSMCPLAGEEKVLIKSSRGRRVEYSSIRNIYEGNSKQEEYEIYSDGKFIKGRFNKFNNQRMIKIVLENGHEIKTSEQHLNFVMTKPKSKELILKGKELKIGMYLPYSLNIYKGEGGNKDLGYFVGCYAGDGSLDGDTAVVFSLENYYKKEVIVKLRKISKDYFGTSGVVKADKKSKLVTLKICSRTAVGLCKDFVENKERNKHYAPKLFTMGTEFRRAVLSGHYATDGGNRNRIYTSSPKMVQSLNILAATLGTTTSIYKDERKNRLGKEPNYAVLIYQLNRKNYGSIWFKKGKRLWMKIKKIKPIQNSAAYCFEANMGTNPIFTVGTSGILTHNCHLRLDNRELRKRGGGLFGANPLTGSTGVVTINMAKLGYLASEEKEFKERLNRLMELAKNSLEIKRKTLERFTDNNLYPYSKYYLGSIKKRFGEYWKNHFSTIGLIGMNEACLNFLGENIGSEAGKKFALEILNFMREKLLAFQKETRNIYNLEATPAEGSSYRLARVDKEEHPDIICANEEKVPQGNGSEPFYTNSTQLPVDYTDDIFEVLDLQDGLQTRYSGGTVIHFYLGERIEDANIVKHLVQKICRNYHLPYFTITPTFSVCPVCGYIAGEHPTCPKCSREAEVYSRVVGYLRPVKQYNKGKKAEFAQRKTFKVT